MSVHIGRHTFDQWDLLGNRCGVGEYESAIGSRPVADPISCTTPSFNPDKVVSQTLELALDAAAARIPNRHNADERTYSHRDAYNREDASHPIALQRGCRFPDYVLQVHRNWRQM
jgi:hypothetical protein